METYPAFFTPRDKEPSHSSFEETSSEFDLLENKIMKEKQSKCFVKYISYFDPPLVGLHLFYHGLIYFGSKIYIEKIFSKKYPNNIFD